MKEKIIFTCANIGYAASQWLIIIVAARVSLEIAGEYSYSLAFIMPVVMFFSLGLRGLLVTEESDSIFLVYYIVRLVGILAVLSVSIFGYYIFVRGNISEMIFISVLLYKTSDIMFDICYARYQQISKIYLITYSKLIRLLCVFFLIGILLITEGFDFYYMLIVLTTLSVVQSLCEFSSSIKKFDYNFIKLKSSSIKIIKNGSKLSIVLMLVMLISSMPRFYIEKHYGLSVLGEFAFINQVIQIGMIVVQSISFIYLRKISDIYKINKKDAFIFFEKIIFSVFILAGICGGGVAFYFSDLSYYLIKIKIDLSGYEVTSIFIFSILLYSQALIGAFLTAIRKITIQPILFFIGFCIITTSLMFFKLNIGDVFIVSSLSYFIVLVYYVYIRIKHI